MLAHHKLISEEMNLTEVGKLDYLGHPWVLDNRLFMDVLQNVLFGLP